MARKRRKGEQTTEYDKQRKKRKSTVPQDTNIEILPPKAPIVEQDGQQTTNVPTHQNQELVEADVTRQDQEPRN